VDTGERLADIRIDGDTIAELFFTPDGNRIRSFDQAGWIITWDAATGARLGKIRISCAPSSQIDAEVTVDSQLTAVACGRLALVRTADLANKENVQYPFTGDIVEATGVAFNPEGTILAASSSVGALKLWDPETGEERFTLSGRGLEIRLDDRGGYNSLGFLDSIGESYGRPLSGVDFSPDGRFLVAAGSDGTVIVYIISIEELMEVARSRLSRGFTSEECRTYLSLDSCPGES
jgi:WD40 repeat protein